MNKKILITGGPVHANLDAVKIITNKFKGGRIAELADKMTGLGANVTYLTSKNSSIPKDNKVNVIYHNGFDDYRQKILEMAPNFDAVILGAAVCNLIPMNPWKGKFPSHDYKVGDRIPIDFTIAPRVIDEVKIVAPNTHLFGFKLLQGVDHEELIEAAYGVVLESRAVCVFANDANDLDTKYAVTKERTVINLSSNDYDKFIWEAIHDKYYSTHLVEYNGGVFCCLEKTSGWEVDLGGKYETILHRLVQKYNDKFDKVYGKNRYRFGTVAVRIGSSNSFVTTARGKKEMEDVTTVFHVNHDSRTIFAWPKKATLNAPLIADIFRERKDIIAIVHYHESYSGNDRCYKLAYAFPGTVRDSKRAIDERSYYPHIFEIEGHGTFELLSEV